MENPFILEAIGIDEFDENSLDELFCDTSLPLLLLSDNELSIECTELPDETDQDLTSASVLLILFTSVLGVLALLSKRGLPLLL